MFFASYTVVDNKNELVHNSTVKEILTVQNEGGRMHDELLAIEQLKALPRDAKLREVEGDGVMKCRDCAIGDSTHQLCECIMLEDGKAINSDMEWSCSWFILKESGVDKDLDNAVERLNEEMGL